MIPRPKSRREKVGLPLGLLRQVDIAIRQSELFTSRAKLIEVATLIYLHDLARDGFYSHMLDARSPSEPRGRRSFREIRPDTTPQTDLRDETDKNSLDGGDGRGF